MSKRKKTPIFLQMEGVECGAAALGTVLSYYGKYVPLEELRLECGVTRDGVKASNILKAAARYGLDGHGYRVEPETLDTVPTPSIIYWCFNHFIVYEGRAAGGGFHVNDPGMGHRIVSADQFDKEFTGVALGLTPSKDFKRTGKKFSFFATCRRWTKSSLGAMSLLLLIGLLLVVPGLALPALTQVVVDDVLIHGMARWLTPLLLILCAVGITRFALEATKRYLLGRLQERIGMRAAADFIWKVLHLPMRFFTQRSAGELASRLLVYDVATGFFSKEAPDAVLDVLVVGFYVALMCAYNVPLALIAVGAATLSIIIFYFFSSRLETEEAVMQQERGKGMAFLVQALSMIETIKLRADESDVLQKTMDHKARIVTAEKKLLMVHATSTYVSELLRLGGSAAVLAVGSRYVMSNQMTLGDLLAFQVLMASFLVPVSSILSFLAAIQEMKVVAKRVEDVAQYPLEPRLEGNVIEQGESRVAGKVLEFRDVSFGYSPTDPPTIQGISFRIEPGRSVAFVGGTGSGKSTLAKLVCGLYRPWSGEILVDGNVMPDLDPSVLGGALALVDQNIALFQGSIRDNLTMWDATIDDADIERAGRDAMIHHVIEKKPDAYHYEVDEDGKNFSGGERQRLEIARALVRSPSLLVLDEATSALDTVTEQKIVNNIRERGCGCLVIAHRLCTIRECDEIVVLDKGHIVDRGSHAELLARSDRYKELVANE
jgi:NHLM bacteriocin system ABC transporter peptidase/ATP-binding protein